MKFTPQQLYGGGKYGLGTRIGNWQEDYELAAVYFISVIWIATSKGIWNKKNEWTFCSCCKSRKS